MSDFSTEAARLQSLGHLEASIFGQLPQKSSQLHDFCTQVERWQRVQNLVSRETPGDLWSRHILDSLQLLPLIGPQTGPLTMLDIGSGGGFPAIPLAIALKGRDFSMHLIESNARKGAFLRAMARDFDLPLTVHTARIEAVDPQTLGPIDLVTSRALAPLPLLLRYVHRFWGPSTRALLHKGREFGEELQQADSDWVYDVLKHQSATDENAVILDITALHPRP